MLSDDKITEIYYMADDLCKFFSGNVKKTHHRGERREKTQELTYPHVGCRNHNHHGDVPLQQAVYTSSSSTPSPP